MLKKKYYHKGTTNQQVEEGDSTCRKSKLTDGASQPDTRGDSTPHVGSLNATARNCQRHSKEPPTPQQGTADATKKGSRCPILRCQILCVGKDLPERYHDEVALMHAWMRDGEPGSGNGEVVVQKQVDVDGPVVVYAVL